MAVLECPQCATRFALPFGVAIGPHGRKVRCGACRHIWKTGEKGEEVEEKLQEIPFAQKSDLGTLVPKHKEKLISRLSSRLRRPNAGLVARAAIYAGMIILCGLAGSLLYLFRVPVTQTWPSARAAYALFNADPPVPGHDLVLDHVLAHTKEERLEVTGVVLNHGSSPLPLPPLEAILKDAQGAEYGRWPILLEQSFLEEGATLPIAASLPLKTKDIPGAPSLTLRFVLF